MKKLLIFVWLALGMVLSPAIAQTPPEPNKGIDVQANVDSLKLGFRYDDNVYRSVFTGSRLSDEVSSLNGGGNLTLRSGQWNAKLDYHLGLDIYQGYINLDNYKNDFAGLLGFQPGDFSFYYRGDYFIRDSQYYFFNYYETNSVLGALWTPPGPWSYEAQGGYSTRNYYDFDYAPYAYSGVNDQPVISQFLIQALDYIDQRASLSVQREMSDHLTVKLEGRFNDRQFNRNLVAQQGGVLVSLPSFALQEDLTWTGQLTVRLYFESVLQELTLEGQRTDSNSYGFSNWVQSVSWTGSLRPFPAFYLQLLARLYTKSYDTTPLPYPGLQVGYVDEESQDVLSLRASWDITSLWSLSVGTSRMRTESLQPGEFYIKDILSFQLQRNF